ncbi:MAG: hypothetical protein NT047_08825 [Deltaproteobacteria bacterium]|nr:hypothetical protein [Deltaproteobacteria bacterium]MCX5855412.1 hypothetical protein [Deltaproteobacteria bacterium]
MQNKKDEAIGSLKVAVDTGFKDWTLLEKDNDLKNIRDTAYYAELTQNSAIGMLKSKGRR